MYAHTYMHTSTGMCTGAHVHGMLTDVRVCRGTLHTEAHSCACSAHVHAHITGMCTGAHVDGMLTDVHAGAHCILMLTDMHVGHTHMHILTGMCTGAHMQAHVHRLCVG